jgi:hypothetical protein
MRRLLAIALVLTVTAASGCGVGGKRKKRSGGGSSNGGAAAPAAQATTATANNDLASKVRAAVIPKDALVSVGGPAELAEPDDEDNFRLGRVCNAKLPTDQIGTNQGIERSWEDDSRWVNNLVTGNADVTAAEAIDAVKTAYGTCKKYSVNGTQYTIVGPLDVGALPGVDTTYAWTETSAKSGGTKGAVCEAFLGKGQVVSWITVEADTAAQTNTACKQIVAIAAKQLADAA